MNSLDNYLIAAPLATILTLLSGLSLAVVFDWAGKVIFRRKDSISRAMYFFAGLLILSWFVWLISLAGFAYPVVFQVLNWFSIALAAFIIFTKRANFPFPNARLFIENTEKNSIGALFPAILIGLITLGYTLLSLAIPTDSDSLSYHLALPVDILQRGDLWFDKDQLHFRMAGFGEMINLLGVANGCPQLGAFIQLLALIYFLEALSEGTERSDWAKAAILVLCMPTLLFLIPGQKHQLTAMLATSVCFLAIFRSCSFDKKTLVLWVAVLLFASGIKYSEFLSCAVLVFLFLLKRPTNVPISQFLILLTAFGLIILGPQFYFRLSHFGDPISPFLEKFTSNPDPVVEKLNRYIKSFRESTLPFPVSLIIPNSFGRIATSLGLSGLILCIVPFVRRNLRTGAACILLLFLAILFGGQVTSRFFMEPVLWGIPLFVTGFGKAKWMRNLMILPQLQGLLLVFMIGFGAWQLGPSLFSNAGRDKVLTQSANGYEESRWLDKVLPKDAHIATLSKSRAFLPSVYFPWEYLVFTSLHDSTQVLALREKLVAHRIDYLILPTEGYQNFKRLFAGKVVLGPKKFSRATRNPFNKTHYELAVYQLQINSGLGVRKSH